MHKIAILFSLIFLALASGKEPSTVQEQDYDIYSQAIGSYVTDDERLLVIRDYTKFYNCGDPYKRIRYFKHSRRLWLTQDLVKDFVQKNKSSSKLESHFHLRIKYTLISDASFRRIFKIDIAAIKRGEDPWSEFKKTYPESRNLNLIAVSRIGFDRQKSHALLYIERSHLCRYAGYLLYLRKENNRWKIKSKARIWCE